MRGTQGPGRGAADSQGAAPAGRAEALVAHYRARIQAGQLPADARLPSVRAAAALHGVSPSTVVAAYERLQALGLVEPRPQRGHFVRAARTPTGVPGPLAGQLVAPPLAPPVDATALIRGMFAEAGRAPGPGAGTLPEQWLDAPLLQRALRHALRDADGALRYGNPAGDPSFRAQICVRLRELGIAAAPAQIVTAVGATHALDIIARTLLRPGDAVLVDEPGWAVEFARLGQLGMHLLPVPRGPNGPDMAVLQQLLTQHRPRLYVTVSVLHNPTGQSLSLAAAHQLLKLAEAHDFLIVEDDSFAWLASGHEPRLCALDDLQRTVYVSGFSKILAPDWRVGFLAAPTSIAERCIDTKLVTSLTAPSLFERALAWLLGRGLLRRHAERVNGQLAAARTRVARLATDADCRFVTPPQGLFGWLETGVDTTQLATQMAGDGWLLAPGSLFLASARPSTCMRVNFATSQDARFWQAFQSARARLLRAVRGLPRTTASRRRARADRAELWGARRTPATPS